MSNFVNEILQTLSDEGNEERQRKQHPATYRKCACGQHPEVLTPIPLTHFPDEEGDILIALMGKASREGKAGCCGRWAILTKMPLDGDPQETRAKLENAWQTAPRG